LGGEEFGEGCGNFGDVGVLHFDETAALDGAGLVDFLFEIDELTDERGVFRNDHRGGVGDGGDGSVGAELADDLGERVDGFGGLDVAERHDVGDDGVALRHGGIFVINDTIFIVDVHAPAGGADASSGQGENVEIGILFVRHEHEILNDGSDFK